MRIYRQEEISNYSRRVAILRVGLPLAACALVAILVLLPSDDLPTAGNGKTMSGGESLQFSGRTNDGSAIDVALANFVEDGELTLVEGFEALMANPDGTTHRVLSRRVATGEDQEYLLMQGGATLTAGNRFEVSGEGFRIGLQDSVLSSIGEVTFQFDGGQGSAGRMIITSKPSNNQDGRSWSFIEFTDGVEVSFLKRNFPEQ